MKTHFKLHLDKRRPKKSGEYPIIYRLTHKRRTTSISSGFEVPEKFWDIKKGQIKTSFKGFDNISRVNNILFKKRSEALALITKLEESGELDQLGIAKVKQRILGAYSKVTFYSYTKDLINRFISNGRIGNARSYKNVLREVKNHTNDVDFPFEELTYDFLVKFEESYLARGLELNGLAVYMRTIRAIFNKAIKEGVVEPNRYPFSQYTIKTTPTKKRAISFAQIEKIVGVELSKDDVLFDARNYFLISFYLMGASFADLAHLKMNNRIDGRIQYRRRKTGKHYDIKISKQLDVILEVYTQGKKADDYILPIIKSEDPEKQNEEVHYALIAYNKRLKRLADKVGIEEHLTSYVSRHSFASLANNKSIPLTAISEMLGHQSIKTTQVYLASLGSEKIDDFNERIINDL
ncbi:MAG: site-specific integrase [Cyclobacteriaceae bacterium]